MTNETSDVAHLLTAELLSRYAEALEAGRELARMYPLMQQHLAGCVACRGALGLLLNAADPSSLSPPDTEWHALVSGQRFLPGQAEGMGSPRATRVLRDWAWRPGSRPSAFGLHLSLDVGRYLAERQPGEPDRRAPGSEKFVLDWPRESDGRVTLWLEITESGPGMATIAGRLRAKRQPALLEAYLFAGQALHCAEVRRGLLRFDEVALDANMARVGLLVETP